VATVEQSIDLALAVTNAALAAVAMYDDAIASGDVSESDDLGSTEAAETMQWQ
jgi:hypothetical protein